MIQLSLARVPTCIKIAFIFCLFADAAKAAEELPILKTDAEKISIEIDGVLAENYWSLNASINPDIFPVVIAEAGSRKVRFISRIDSIDFTVTAGNQHDFVIQRDGVSYPTRIVGHKVSPGDIKLQRSLFGNDRDVRPSLHGPALYIDGAAGLPGIQAIVDELRGCGDCDAKLDVVVLASLTYQYNHPFAPTLEAWDAQSLRFSNSWGNTISKLNGVDSVQVFSASDQNDAASGEIRNAVATAELVLFSSISACDLVQNFSAPTLRQAIQSVHNRGGGVGGLLQAAGVLGGILYDGCVARGAPPMKPSVALSNPYNQSIAFTYDFLKLPNLKHMLIDQVARTPYTEQDGMGRALTFLARQIQDGKSKKSYAIGVGKGAAVIVDRNGVGRVLGTSDVFFMAADHRPQVSEPGKPLTYSNLKVWQVPPGGKFNLKKKPMTGYYTVSVDQGRLSRDLVADKALDH